MKIVFFGTPNYVIPILNSLHKKFSSKTSKSSIVAVITQKPKPAGREKKLTYSPVDTWAYKKNIEIFFDCMDIIKRNVKCDLGIVASYGSIIPQEVINYFPNGILNIHPSLLPQWRGASPIQATIISGQKITGVTIIKIDEKLDHGPIISQFKENIQENDTTDSLRRRLFERSAEVLVTLIPAYLKGKINSKEQDHKNASFTKIIKKEDGFIPVKILSACMKGAPIKSKWEISFIKSFKLLPSPTNLDKFISAMKPWPIAWTFVKIKGKEFRIKILTAHLESFITNSQKPYEKLVLDEVQLEGKNPVSWKQFQSGYATAIFE